MTKQAKITKEMIDQVAFQLVKEQGFEAITARNLAQAVGCSTQPIYKIYENLEQLKAVVGEKICQYMHEKVYGYQRTKDPFLNAGLGYVNFAATEPVLYRELVIDNQLQQTLFGAHSDEVLFERLEEEVAGMDLDETKKRQLYLDILIYTSGLASLLYAGQLKLTEEQIAEMLIRFVEQTAGLAYDRQKAGVTERDLVK